MSAHRRSRSDRRKPTRPTTVIAAGAVLAAALMGAGCTSGGAASSSTPGVVNAVGAESQYANVLSQIGGTYVHVSSVLDNPNTDPHTFEASTSVAEEVSRADLVVQNGIGYDDFMNKIESASPNPHRKVDRGPARARTPRQHPEPTPLVQPEDDARRGQGHGVGPRRRSTRATGVLRGETARRSTPRSRPGCTPSPPSRPSYGGTPVATTEPVADYLLQAMGMRNRDAVHLPGRHHERGRPLS